ncbi:MAG TPA: hypothetical protein PKY77_05635 [Phycisphaerae bacterium]|nr:hypothetical protein [Phycisphaerae bacterium]HRY69075.1 hypothetical protein [Phycisphaerae bacterium]HSA25950.1 hypothetical protein [Phycisphaerae bacterium]
MARKTDTPSPVALRLDVNAKRRLEELRQRFGMTAKELGGRIIESFFQLPRDLQVVMLGQLSKQAEIAVIESVLASRRGTPATTPATATLANTEQAAAEESTARILASTIQQLREQSLLPPPPAPPARNPKRKPG